MKSGGLFSKAQDDSQTEAVQRIEAAMEKIEQRIEKVDVIPNTNNENRKTSKQ